MNFASFFSRGIGTLLLILFPPVKQKLAFTVFGIVQVGGYLTMCLAHLYPSHHQLILIIGMVFYGSSRVVFMVPFILASQFFDTRTE